MALKHAFPSSPQRPPLLGLSFRHPDNDAFQHVAFASLYAAKHFLDAILDNTSFKWVSDDEIEVHKPHYFTIKCDGIEAGLDTVFEYKFTNEELNWELPDNYRRMASQIRGNSAPTLQKAPETASQPEKRVLAKPEPKPARPKQPVASPKPSAEGLTTIGDVAASYGFDAKQARGIMRKAGIDKPASGRWEWASVPASVHKAFKDAKK